MRESASILMSTATSTRLAYVNYQVDRPEGLQIQVDPNGETGRRIEPEHDRRGVRLHDLRVVPTDFVTQGLVLLETPSLAVDVRDPETRDRLHTPAIETLLKQQLGASDVHVFDHTLRGFEGERVPAQHVHVDYSSDAGSQRLRDVLPPLQAEQWLRGHYGIVNVWQPVEHSVERDPLAFVDVSTVQPDDWVDIDILYPDRRGQIQGLVHNPAHRWYFASRMRPNEAILFNAFDSAGKPPVAHTAAELLNTAPEAPTRTSLETRVLVRYAD